MRLHSHGGVRAGVHDAPPHAFCAWLQCLSGFRLQAALCAFAATVVCALVYGMRHPLRISPLYGLAMGLLFAGTLLAARFALLEREFRVRLTPRKADFDICGPICMCVLQRVYDRCHWRAVSMHVTGCQPGRSLAHL